MWSKSIGIEYDENGKPITMFEKNPELLQPLFSTQVTQNEDQG